MMRAASREAYRAAADRLDAIGRDGDAAEMAKIGDELLAVANLLDREPRLRRALADPSRSGADRAALLDSLVGRSVTAHTREVLEVAVSGRWSGALELLGGIEMLGVDALLAGADLAGDLAEVEDEMFRFGQVIDGSPELAAVLGELTVDPAQRNTLVDRLLTGKAKPVTVRLVHLAVAGFGGRTLTGALTRLVELSADRRKLQVAYVTVATPLSDAEERQLGTRLAQMYGREMSVKVTVDPDVLGGARVLIGSDLYDGTISRRLADARNTLIGK
ncbi:MAG TPA: F0F1 ATP synthase subunit delta [Micromonosporaceae bacterium]|nr:F0F1 ATP synthase subunit delta [Micromonosporaceae bacterium]